MDEKTDNMCDSVVQLGLYWLCCDFFFAICNLDIEHTEEKLNKLKTVSECGA